MPERRVVVENRKTGEQYAVTPAAFRKHYDAAGFRILHWEGGEEYVEQPAKAAKDTSAAAAKRRERARERRAAKRAQAAAQPVGPQPQPDTE